MTPLPEYLWHGTTVAHLEKILLTGLDPVRRDYRDLRICLTSERKVATHFGMRAAHKCDTPTVLIRVPSAALDTALLAPDATLMVSPFGKGLELDLSKIEENIKLMGSFEHASWQESLDACSGVIYRGPIPVTPDMVDISTLDLRRRTRLEHCQIEVDGIEPEDCLTPAEPVFVEDPLGHALSAKVA